MSDYVSATRSTHAIEVLEIDGSEIPMVAGTLRVTTTPLGLRWEADLAFPAIVSLPDPRRALTVTIRTRAGLFTESKVLRGFGAIRERRSASMVIASVGDDGAWLPK